MNSKLVTLSDFNVQNLNALLQNDPEAPRIEVVGTPYGQVAPILLDPGHPCWADEPDVAVVWTQPGVAVPSYSRLLRHEAVPLDAILAEVDAFASMIVGAGERVGLVLVPTWTLSGRESWPGLLAFAEGVGPANVLARMNLRLSERLAGASGCYVLDAGPWMERGGARAANPKHWYLSKTAFGTEVFKAAADAVKSAIRGARGLVRKVVIVDLDDTLWGGIVGEVGWENVRVGGHDPIGEAFVDFQRGLQALTNRGILLAIASKNDEDVALTAIDRHPEMVLRRGDFAAWRINWGDKAANIADLMDELNLGLDSAVFLDDNPVERARVREALPDVFVPDLPEDKLHYRTALSRLTCFDSPSLSAEDRVRTESYRRERERKALKTQVGDLDAWLASLETEVRVSALDDASMARTVQLLNKTNQMNLTTRRLTERELEEWVEGEGRGLWTFSVRDRVGELGLVGIMSMEPVGEGGSRIVDFILSCRAFGRHIEEAMLAAAVEFARAEGVQRVEARLVPTPKNKPCREFLSRSGWDLEDDVAISWSVDRSYAFPSHLAVEFQVPGFEAVGAKAGRAAS